MRKRPRKAYLRKAQRYLESGAPRKAAVLYREVLAARPTDRGAWLWAGAALAEAGLSAQARESVDRGIALDPAARVGRLFLARVLYDAGQNADARQVLEQYLAREPNQQAEALLAASRVRLGDRRFPLADLPAAPWVLARLLGAVEDAGREPPETPVALPEAPVRGAAGDFRRGMVALRAEKWLRAWRAFTGARVRRPDDPAAACGLAVALYYLNHFEPAHHLLLETLERLPPTYAADGLATLGKCDFELGRLPDAVQRLRRAVAGGAATPENYYALGLAWVRAGRPRHARRAFQKCVTPGFVRQRFETIIGA